MIKIERAITIHRSVEDVFTYLSDVGHDPQYISGQREAHKTSAGPMGIGATFATTGKFLRRRATNEVAEYEPNHRFAWKATSGARVTTTWGFEPSGSRTRVTFTRVADATGHWARSKSCWPRPGQREYGGEELVGVGAWPPRGSYGGRVPRSLMERTLDTYGNQS